MSKYNTNLASEFYVLSMFYRLGADAALTLGNKKAIDIFIHRDDGTTLTVDVKGVTGSYNWPIDNVQLSGEPNHFIALVSIDGKIADPAASPSVWIIPSVDIEPFTRIYPKRTIVPRSLVNKKGAKYRDAWAVLTGDGQ